MTAEVALLNKTAVALAADSAMTVLGTGKIYPANKLFALTRHHPVGVMIYNNAELMGVPWETIIKMYRQSIGANTKPSCRDYLLDFLDCIGKSPVCTGEQEIANLMRIASAAYARIAGAVDDDLRDLVSRQGRFSTRDESKAIRNAVEKRLAALQGTSVSQSMGGVNANQIARAHRSKLDECIDREFRDYSLSRAVRRSLHRIFTLTIKSAEPSGGHSGIVVAGFGESEMFPTLVEVTTEGMVAGKLKYEVRRETDIGREGTFASEELASMAEALINLTSLKRRVSLDQETVGGPIDIAIISKGDGFVWIKRKHYFDPALNPSYFYRQSL